MKTDKDLTDTILDVYFFLILSNPVLSNSVVLETTI